MDSAGSKASAKAAASEKRARRAQNPEKKAYDTARAYARQYSKYMRIAASSIFKTANPYHDEYLGFWQIPALGDPPPTVDSLFPLLAGSPRKQWGNDAKIGPQAGGGKSPEAVAAEI